VRSYLDWKSEAAKWARVIKEANIRAE